MKNIYKVVCEENEKFLKKNRRLFKTKKKKLLYKTLLSRKIIRKIPI